MTMEPNNMENQFRDKLNKREIKPSENSWDRLDAMLTVAEKPKRNYRWMYFAASFLGFILIATVFFNQTEEVVDSEHNKVVIEEKQVKQKDNELDKVLEIPSENAVKVVVVTQKVITKEEIKKSNKSSQITVQKTPTQTAIVLNEKSNSSSITHQKTEVKVDVSALLASVDYGKSASSKTKNVSPIKVDKNELLSQVDDELELSFRERIIQSVNKKYREVKVAAANRNLE